MHYGGTSARGLEIIHVQCLGILIALSEHPLVVTFPLELVLQ